MWGLLRFLNLWVYVSCQTWEVFSHYLVKYFFSPSSLSSFMDSNYTNLRPFVIVSQSSKTILLRLFRLGNFYFSVNRFFSWCPSFYQLSCPLNLLFQLSYFPVLKLPFDSLFIWFFYFFAEVFCFFFVVVSSVFKYICYCFFLSVIL